MLVFAGCGTHVWKSASSNSRNGR